MRVIRQLRANSTASYNCGMIRFLLLPLMLAADPAEVAKRIRENDLAWLRSQPAQELLEAIDARQNTPLLWAATLGSAEAVELLLNAGANPNEANALGITPLIAASTEADKVKLLLAAGADVKAKSKAGQHALAASAAGYRSTEAVKLLLAAGAPVNERSSRGSTPLLAALASNCVGDTVRALLAAGADAKASDGANFGAVHGAISCEPDLLRDILRRGAQVNQQNSFSGAVKHGDIQLKGLSPLMLAAAHYDAAKVKMLLDAGADVKAKDVRGMTPLMFAVSSENQDPAVVKLLLAKGADRAGKDTYGQDAVAWARKFNHPAVLKLLGATPAPAAPEAGFGKGPGTPAALARIEQGTEGFFAQSGCNGCHHSHLTSFVASRAKTAGLSPQPALMEARGLRLKAEIARSFSASQQMLAGGGDIDSVMYWLLEAQGLGGERTAEAEMLARYLWAKQMPDGSWSQHGVSRSPIEEADLHRTALTVWLAPRFTNPALAPMVPARVEQARRWLEAQTARTTDERAMKLLGLKWAGGAPAMIEKAAKDLGAAQQRDGSWGGNRHLRGDAYSTGLALFALREGGAWPANHPKLAAGARWLKRTQHEDGTWLVRSRAPKFQPYFESGFPYGPDQWISAAGTAWAVAGLVEVGELR